MSCFSSSISVLAFAIVSKHSKQMESKEPSLIRLCGKKEEEWRSSHLSLFSGENLNTIALLSAGEFIGEESIAGAAGLRMATAITACTALKIERVEMIRVMHKQKVTFRY